MNGRVRDSAAENAETRVKSSNRESYLSYREIVKSTTNPLAQRGGEAKGGFRPLHQARFRAHRDQCMFGNHVTTSRHHLTSLTTH